MRISVRLGASQKTKKLAAVELTYDLSLPPRNDSVRSASVSGVKIKRRAKDQTLNFGRLAARL